MTHDLAPADRPVADLPLADLIVLDLSIARAGPTAVRQLADWGADVIRIEPPQPEVTAGGHHSPDYLNLHRNKRSLALDLKHADGRRVLHRLVERADVLIENMRTPVKHRLGFDWDTLSAINPRIVLGSISGFGQTGPYADRGGVDQIAQGLGGMMSVTGLPGQGPVRAGVAISDVTAGLQLAVGVLVALHERERTGRGRWVHTSLLESMIGMLDFQAARWTVEREVAPQAGNDHPTLGPMGTYRTGSGLMNVAAPWGHIWTTFCEVIGRPDLVTDPRFESQRDRGRNRDELNQEIEAALADRPADEWVAALNERGVPAGPVNDIGETFADPQVKHLGVATPVQHRTVGPIEVVRNATNIEGVANEIRSASPEPGQHSDSVLSQFGFGQDEIEALAASGAIATPTSEPSEPEDGDRTA